MHALLFTIHPRSNAMHALRFAVLCAALVAACAQSKPLPEPAAKQQAAVQPAPAPVAEPPATPAPAEPVAQPVKPAPKQEGPAASLFFDFDKSLLTDVSRARLAHLLDAAGAPGARVRIEGNCDERGTVEYNIGLGQRRADAARSYLVRLGVPADRIQPTSYGKEHPKASGHDEASWKENRRADVFIDGAQAVAYIR
jgi:peptidoglycan-associated lipoprotein